MSKQALKLSSALPPPPQRPKNLQTFLGRDWKLALIFILPILILMAGLIFWPFVSALYRSLTVRSFITGEEQFVGLRNYIRLWQDSDFISAVRNTARFTIFSLAFKFIIGMAIALLLNSRLPFRGIITGLMLLPWIVPEVVTALAWRSIYDPIFGGLNPILQGLGIIDRPMGWLSEPHLALPSVIAVNVWKGIPFFTLLLLAGLKAVDRELLEAAQVDGANVIQRFRHVTLPSLRYVIATTLLLSFISTFNTFGLIYLMTGGGPGGATRMYMILSYEQAFIAQRHGPGIATAFSMAPLIGVFIVFLARFMQGDYNRTRTTVTVLDRILEFFGRIFGFMFGLLFLPFEWLADVLEKFRSNRRRLKYEQRERLGITLRVLAILPVLLFVLFPFYWIIITSFKTDLQIQQFRSIFVPSPWTMEQYRSLLGETPFLLWFRNTVFVATVSTFISVALSSVGAYALARLKFTGSKAMTTLLLVTYLLPGGMTFIQLYIILTNLGVINTHMSLILTYPTFLIPFATWVMLGYFRSIPVELEEAALIDGTTRFGAFWRITLPLAAPAILSVTLFAFTNAWNEFFLAFVMITSEHLKTLPVGLQLLVFGDIYPWGQLMAASLLMAIPVMCVYIYAQRFLVEGLTAGGVKA
ncbi:MAG: ABC transporter permease subunit [Trueperaceae bacterium]